MTRRVAFLLLGVSALAAGGVLRVRKDADPAAAAAAAKDTKAAQHGDVVAAYVRERAALGKRPESAYDAVCDWEETVLAGACTGKMRDAKSATDDRSAAACEASCCASSTCVSWQYRRGDGCKHGGDTRVGDEKDGPGAWCEASPPERWSGQQIDGDRAACDSTTWNPTELDGQCFGLGDQRKGIETAAECRDACCASIRPVCTTWQWRDDKGCFAGRSKQCHARDDRGPFAGHRKRLPGRTYRPPAVAS